MLPGAYDLKRLRVQIQYFILSRSQPICKGSLLSCFLGSFRHGNKELPVARAPYVFCLSLQFALSPGSLAMHSSYSFSEIKQGCCTVICYRQQSQRCLWKWASISQVSGNRVQGGFWQKRKSLRIRNFLLPKSLLLILIRETQVGENYVFSAWAEFYTVGFRDWECRGLETHACVL